MTLGSSLAKTTGSWAVGAATGSLDTGTVAINTWYHVFLIKRVDTGVVDILTSLSASSPTMPTNYTLKRRIGSIRTNGSSQWIAFAQLGDEFLWKVAVIDKNNATAPTASRSLIALTVPSGVQVQAMFRAGYSGTSAGNTLAFTSPDENDQVVGSTGLLGDLAVQTAAQVAEGRFMIRTDTSSQIGIIAATATGYWVYTYGWTDQRGKLY